MRWFAGSDDRANLTFDVYFGTNESSLTKVADDITTLSYSPSNLAMNIKYFWKVVATDPSGSISSSVMNFTVEVAPEWGYNIGAKVAALDISADGEYIAAGSNGNVLHLFHKDSGTPLWTYSMQNYVRQVSVSADGEYIAAGSYSGHVFLFDKDSSTPLWSYDYGQDVLNIEISADGEHIVGTSRDNLFFFNKVNNTILWDYELDASVSRYALDISEDGNHIAVATGDSEGGRLYVFDKTGTLFWTFNIDGEDYEFSSVSISSDGEYIIASNYNSKSYLFTRNSSTPVWTHEADTEGSKRNAISASGEYIVVGSNDGSICLFDNDSSTPLWTYEADDSIYSISISADGEYILVGSKDNNVYLFDKDNSAPIWTFDALTSDEEYDSVFSVAISGDGKYLTVGTDEDNDSGFVYLFKNNLVDRLSLLPYGPAEGSNTDTEPQLGWFAGSDDRANLTFDVYLDTDSDPDTKVADDITTLYYNTQCLSLNTKYYWKVVATDGDDTVTSSVMNFTVTSYGNIFCVSIDDDYDPDTLTIKKGSTVIWTNDDNSLHTVTEDDDEFDSGSISPGNTWSYTFNTVGTYDYYDQYDDDLDGQIIVLVSYQPTASIDSISPQIAELDNSVSFSGSGSDSDGTISEYKWISSIDGDLSTSASFSTTDLTFGNHTITFRVKDNDGVWSDNVTSWVDVRKSPEWRK